MSTPLLTFGCFKCRAWWAVVYLALRNIVGVELGVSGVIHAVVDL